MKETITTEQEGILHYESLESMADYLSNIAEISNGGEDFVKKCSFGLTDQTSGFESADQAALEDWYYRVYLEM